MVANKGGCLNVGGKNSIGTIRVGLLIYEARCQLSVRSGVARAKMPDLGLRGPKAQLHRLRFGSSERPAGITVTTWPWSMTGDYFAGPIGTLTCASNLHHRSRP